MGAIRRYARRQREAEKRRRERRAKMLKQLEETSQAERQEHLRQLGWSEESIVQAGEIPCEALLLSDRKLTQAEKDHALSLGKPSSK